MSSANLCCTTIGTKLPSFLSSPPYVEASFPTNFVFFSFSRPFSRFVLHHILFYTISTTANTTINSVKTLQENPMRSLPPPRITRKRRWRRFKRFVATLFNKQCSWDYRIYDKSDAITHIRGTRTKKGMGVGFRTVGALWRFKS